MLLLTFLNISFQKTKFLEYFSLKDCLVNMLQYLLTVWPSLDFKWFFFSLSLKILSSFFLSFFFTLQKEINLSFQNFEDVGMHSHPEVKS